MSNEIKFKDIIVAVHGIGEQKRFSTVRSVANRLAASRSLLGKVTVHPVAPQPLGYFHSEISGITSVCRLDDVESLKDMELASIGFAEVFWADIPQEVDKEGRTLEETKAWARTVVARANALCDRAVARGLSTFSVNDLRDPSLLAGKLKHPKDPVSIWLGDQLSSVTRTALANYQDLDLVPMPLQAALVEDLNRIIRGPSIFDAQRFTGVSIRSETRQLILQKPEGNAPLALNMRLLEEAYRQEISRKQIIPPDFTLASEVLDEIIETIYVLENLFFIADKAGVFKFDLRRVLEEYLGDVQIVTEFAYHRTDIVGRFHRAMEEIYKKQCDLLNPEVRLHIVAHSEGTVVSFLGLLLAMSTQTVIPEDSSGKPKAEICPPGQFPEWLKNVKGYMTIGSPIDKHLLLWPRLWAELDPQKANQLFANEPIRWRNYYDYGDPVGFMLDSARLWLDKKECTSFQFRDQDDFGFARYLVPGEAHNEYWNDSDVFEHFITDVVRKPNGVSKESTPPRTRWHIFFLSPLLPYLFSFILLCLGVFVLYKAVHAYTHPSYDPLQRFVRFTELGLKPDADLSGWDLFRVVLGISSLISGATLLARIPRLARGATPWPRIITQAVGRLLHRCTRFAFGPWWMLLGTAAFVLGCRLYLEVVPFQIQEEIDAGFYSLRRFYGEKGPTLGVLSLAALAGLSGFLVMSPSFGNPDRRKRWLFRGMRPLILCGALAVGLIIVLQISPQPLPLQNLLGPHHTELTSEQRQIIQETRLTMAELNEVRLTKGTNWLSTLEKVEPVLVTDPPTWPVVLAGVAFLYLWWLATLIFDLAFVWHRYIRHSTTNKRLKDWNPYGFDLRPKPRNHKPRHKITELFSKNPRPKIL